MQFIKKHKFPVIIFLLSFVSRILFIPKYIFHWDGVQYVLGVLDFDIYSHQPHPPGFINYIAIGKFFNIFFNDAKLSLAFLSIICCALSAIFFYFILIKIFKDKKEAFLYTLLFCSSPVVWFYSEIINTFIPGMCALLLIIYISIGKKNMYLISFICGWFLGARIYLIFILLPILAFFILKSRVSWHKRNIFVMLFLAGILIWFLPTIYHCGGLGKYLKIYQEHISFNLSRTIISSDYSFFLSLCINLIYVFWACRYFILFILTGFIFYLSRNYKIKYFGIDRWIKNENNLLFLIWLISGFIFCTLFSVINAGYLISIVPVIFIFSFIGLNYMVTGTRACHIKMIIIIIFILLNCYNFIFTDGKVTLANIKGHDETFSEAISVIKGNFKPDETVVISYSFFDFGLRHAAYYLPGYYVFLEEEIKGGINPIPFFKGRRVVEKKRKILNGYVFPDKVKYVVFWGSDLEKFKLTKVYSNKLKRISSIKYLMIK